MLEGLDLDFLTVGREGLDGRTYSDFGTRLSDQEDFSSRASFDKQFDRDWYVRRMSIGSDALNGVNINDWRHEMEHSNSFDKPLLQSDFFEQMGKITDDYGIDNCFGIGDDIGDDGFGNVDLGAYISVAAQLQHSSANIPSKLSKVLLKCI